MLKNKKIYVITAIIIVVIAAAFSRRKKIEYTVKNKASEVIVEKLLDEKIVHDRELPDYITARKIYESMTAEDRQTVNDMMIGYMTDENMKQVKSYIAGGDMPGLKKFVKSKLSKEDKTAVQNMYDKYKYKIKKVN